MKELESPLKVTPDTELVAEIQKEYTLKGKMAVQRGLTLFAVKYPEMIAEAVKITSTPIVQFDKTVKTEHRASYDPQAIYMWALNAKVAIKKVEKQIERYILKQEEIKKHYATKDIMRTGDTVSINGVAVGQVK